MDITELADATRNSGVCDTEPEPQPFTSIEAALLYLSFVCVCFVLVAVLSGGAGYL